MATVRPLPADTRIAASVNPDARPAWEDHRESVQPAIFLFELSLFSGDSIRGIIGCASALDYHAEKIASTEEIDNETVARLAKEISDAGTLRTLSLLAFADSASLNAHMEIDATTEPIIEFETEDHCLRIMRVEAPDEYCKSLMEQPGFYIAENPETFAAFAKLQTLLAEENTTHTGQENYNYCPALFVSLGELRSFATALELQSGPVPASFSETFTGFLQYPIDDPSGVQ